jgi:hypothetical protein
MTLDVLLVTGRVVISFVVAARLANCMPLSEAVAETQKLEPLAHNLSSQKVSHRPIN